jgi:hypothetical protein
VNSGSDRDENADWHPGLAMPRSDHINMDWSPFRSDVLSTSDEHSMGVCESSPDGVTPPPHQGSTADENTIPTRKDFHDLINGRPFSNLSRDVEQIVKMCRPAL